MDEQRAVVWDLDGVIVDSAEAHNASWQAMADEFDLEFDPERDFHRYFGRHNADIISSLWGVEDPDLSGRMAASKEGYFRNTADVLRPLPGVLALMEELRGRGWRQGIGSSAPRANIDALLRATGTASFIEAISSGDDVTEGKPNPRVFEIAFEQLGMKPSQGVVIEDAPAGVQGGIRAGAAVVGVTTGHPSATLAEAGANLVVSSLDYVTVDDLEQLVVANQDRATNTMRSESSEKSSSS